MKTEEIKKVSGGRAILTTTTGACKFCGQSAVVEVPEEWQGSDTDEYITEKCECSEACRYTTKKRTIEKSEETIEYQFGDKAAKGEVNPDTRGLLMDCVKMMMEDQISKVTVDINAQTKATINYTEKGIKIKRSDKEEEERIV